RWGVSAETPAASPWELPADLRDFDLVLADVPCSNTGVFRRRPDALWHDRQSDPALLALQRKILDAAAARTASGGNLIYSTCSIDPAENEEQISRFLEDNPEFALQNSITLYPGKFHDGAFGALLVRR
ncbi:MAG: 16S rRNA (cytosine(967)-C(5))-methyltransferase RsmB, partial [Lentisphaeria bacterium]|nr:16S rRNA (cytosine(967)-C(5))-methyltransferase RsmB [Lentisphaeria bacterium]